MAYNMKCDVARSTENGKTTIVSLRTVGFEANELFAKDEWGVGEVGIPQNPDSTLNFNIGGELRES